MSDDHEKRQTQRIQPFVAPCKVVFGEQRVVGYLTDLSPRGARVSSDGPLPAAGSAVVVEVRFGRRPSLSRLPGTVKWALAGAGAADAGTFGLTFESLGPEDEQTLQSVVEEFKRRAALLA